MSVKDRLSKAWAEDLEARWPGNVVVPKRRNAAVSLPQTVVVVKTLSQTTPGSDVWEGEVRIVHVSETKDTLTGAHADRVEVLRKKIEETYRPAIDMGNKVVLYGFVIEDHQDAEGSSAEGTKVFSDVFMIRVGVGGTL
jgi:hypothetical protein